MCPTAINPAIKYDVLDDVEEEHKGALYFGVLIHR
jgi:hypothetical protein